ncbi:hypothetical protein LC574_13395 [Nostoc sp. CHAB 5715]|nr:hypothetical protein [Nostoc sp. CHAB 5715]
MVTVTLTAVATAIATTLWTKAQEKIGENIGDATWTLGGKLISSGQIKVACSLGKIDPGNEKAIASDVTNKFAVVTIACPFVPKIEADVTNIGMLATTVRAFAINAYSFAAITVAFIINA